MVTFKKSSFPLTHIVENTFYVDTLFKLAEFTTDVEIIIKQKVWAVNGNFQEIKFPVTQCILSYHDTDLKLIFYILSRWKLPLTHLRQNVLRRILLKLQAIAIIIRAGDNSCLRQLSENRVFQCTIIDKTHFS